MSGGEFKKRAISVHEIMQNPAVTNLKEKNLIPMSVVDEAKNDYPDEHRPEYWEEGVFLEGKFYEDVDKWFKKKFG